MKLKIDQPVLNYDGSNVELPDKANSILTFRTVIENTLNSHDEKHPLTAEKKLHAFQIGVKLFSKKLEQYDLTVDQVGFIKERVGLFYGPVVYGRFLELIGDQAVKLEKD
jgi:hypothetical protein